MAKKAFLVGINTFTRPTYRLRGCINDTIAMKENLTSYFGFEEDEIKVVHDQDATRKGIRGGLNWLIEGAQPGDVLVFHFSSHGTQVPDDSEDEMEVQDEVIVPYDHDWDNPFRDDHLRETFAAIPEGVNFTFIADCCHSGSIQRALLEQEIDFKPRYLQPPAKKRDRITEAYIKREDAADAYAAEHLMELLAEVPREQWKEKTKEYLALLRKQFRENKFRVVPYERHFLLAACEDRQTAADAHLEGDYRGAFSWAISKTIREANGELTYDDLVRGVGGHLKDFDQIPQLECPADVRVARLFAPL
ncbi:MAG: caspase family protein [Ardenticatenaceae bacterium]